MLGNPTQYCDIMKINKYIVHKLDFKQSIVKNAMEWSDISCAYINIHELCSPSSIWS